MTGLARLTKLRSLAHLEVCGGSITSAGLAPLPCCASLRTLNISQNPAIGDRGLAPLALLPVLESLNLSSSRVGPAGLPTLKKMASLTCLGLHGCAFDRSHAAQLRVALPRLLTLGIDGAT